MQVSAGAVNLLKVNLLKVHLLVIHLLQVHLVQVKIAGQCRCRCSDITGGQWRQIGREVAALGLNFNEISAANSGRKEKEEGCDERKDEKEEMRRM